MTVTKIFFVAGLLPLLRHKSEGSISLGHRVADPIPTIGGALRNRWDFICWSEEAMP